MVYRPGNNDCNHQVPKLKNIGLVIAETICHTLLMKAPEGHSRYLKGNGEGWEPIDKKDLLYLVEKSSSQKVREAVRFCLEYDPGKEGNNVGKFYVKYVDKVLQP
jgi:hypothetical protein